MLAQGSQTNAKEDTVLLLLTSDAQTDLSQFGTDLTASAAGSTYASIGGYEDTSARGALDGVNGRELFTKILMVKGDKNRTLIYHGNPSDITDHTYHLYIDKNAKLIAMENDVILVTIPFTFSTDPQNVGISWSTRNNPLTTGAGDALISEINIYAFGDEVWEEPVQFTHSVPGTDTGGTLMIGGFGDNTTWDRDVRSVIQARVGRAWHTSVEFFEDWVSSRLPSCIARPQNYPVVGPYHPDAGFGDESEWAGCANAGYSKRIAQTSVSAYRYMPLVNEVYHDAMTYQLITTVDSPQWMMPMTLIHPYSPRDYMDVTKLRYVKVPTSLALKSAYDVEKPWVTSAESGICTRVRVRVHVQSWVTSGGAVPIRVLCTAMTRPIGWTISTEVPSLPPAFEAKTATAELDINHGAAGYGQWLDLGVLEIGPVVVSTPKVWEWSTYFCLGWSIAPAGGEANEGNARLKIRAWSVVPEWPDDWEVKA